MPFYAERSTDGRIVSSSERDDSEEYACIECSAPFSFVKSHTRDGVFIPAHFRHPTSGGGGGGGGGCGESDRHRQMKAIAAAKLQHLYDIDEVDITLEDVDVDDERKIGENIADVRAVFSEPHEKYGNGFAVEVQYRNETKDIEDVTDNYLENGYSVVWLWEEQFDFGSRDVDLFKGDVRSVWPEAVPESVDWQSPQMPWIRVQNGLFNQGDETSITARFPPEYVDELAQRIKQNCAWPSLFPDTSDTVPISRYLGDNRGSQHRLKRYDADRWVSDALEDEPESTPIVKVGFEAVPSRHIMRWLGSTAESYTHPADQYITDVLEDDPESTPIIRVGLGAVPNQTVHAWLQHGATDGHGREIDVTERDDVPDMLKARVDWSHSHDRTPFENLLAFVQSVHDTDLSDDVNINRETLERFASRHIAGLGATYTQRALDRIENTHGLEIEGTIIDEFTRAGRE